MIIFYGTNQSCNIGGVGSIDSLARQNCGKIIVCTSSQLKGFYDVHVRRAYKPVIGGRPNIIIPQNKCSHMDSIRAIGLAFSPLVEVMALASGGDDHIYWICCTLSQQNMHLVCNFLMQCYCHAALEQEAHKQNKRFNSYLPRTRGNFFGRILSSHILFIEWELQLRFFFLVGIRYAPGTDKSFQPQEIPNAFRLRLLITG